MSTSDTSAPDRSRPAHFALIVLLIAANAALVSLGAGLSGKRFGSDTAESPLNPPRSSRRLDARAVLRNPDYFEWLCERVRAHRGILFFGTSESGQLHNVGAQLNDIRPEDPPVTVLPMMGMSPIHSAVVFARSRAEEMPLPPTMLVINLVYFTESHDVINDGWMSTVVRNPVFMQFDDGGVRQHLSAGVREAYDAHFRLRSILAPLLYQEYVGSLLYLDHHQAGPGALPADSPAPERYHFDGALPDYDTDRNVHRGYMPSDQLSKGRWRVRTESDCLNLKGVESTARLLRGESAPALLLVLPVNRAFYRSQGLDMNEFDARYAALRRRVAGQASPGHVFVADLYDQPALDRGFEDRMHADEYGNHQLAQVLAELPEYREFINAVRAYYDATAADQPGS
jgi:hypothetical protein